MLVNYCGRGDGAKSLNFQIYDFALLTSCMPSVLLVCLLFAGPYTQCLANSVTISPLVPRRLPYVFAVVSLSCRPSSAVAVLICNTSFFAYFLLLWRFLCPPAVVFFSDAVRVSVCVLACSRLSAVAVLLFWCVYWRFCLVLGLLSLWWCF